MKVIDLRSERFEEWKHLLNRRYLPAPELIQQVTRILADVRRNGDRALMGLSKRYDRVDLEPRELRVNEAEIVQALNRLDPLVRDAVEASRQNVQEFAQRSRRTDWVGENAQGARIGERFDPFQRIGIYIPAGTAPLVSSAIMTVSLASAIGVPEIVVASPVGSQKIMNPDLLCALQIAGATEIYKIGGAQAIGALAFGTESIRPVTKVFGPGNAYVIEAKRQVFGYVAVDLLPGPSEILVLADHTANPAWVAADLLAQAEHGPGSVVCLVSTEPELADAVQLEIREQLKTLTRKSFLEPVLEQNAFAVVVRDRRQAIEVTNSFSPEHLSIVMESADELADKITTAGAIFLGEYSPVAAGDFLAGPSHELPTGGAGKAFGGLTVDQFQRRTSVVRYDRAALEKSLSVLKQFSEVEQLDAHGRSVTIRFG
jgi:histidinol dehydrogenase